MGRPARGTGAAERPAWDIAPPPNQKWQLRVIVWEGRNLPNDVDDSGLGDWYVNVKFTSGVHAVGQKSTDTHFRAAKGKASWNYRFLFDVDLTYAMKDQRLELKLYDKDILPGDDCAGLCTIPLTRFFQQKFHAGVRKGAGARASYWDPDPLGKGKKDPLAIHKAVDSDENPKLPKPVGRLRFTINPFAMCFQLLGPKLCGKLMCFFAVAVGVLLVYYIVPVVMGNVITGNVG